MYKAVDRRPCIGTSTLVHDDAGLGAGLRFARNRAAQLPRRRPGRSLCLWPFGRTLVRWPDAGAASLIGNVIWFVLAGW
jgi:hypothetical protein